LADAVVANATQQSVFRPRTATSGGHCLAQRGGERPRELRAASRPRVETGHKRFELFPLFAHDMSDGPIRLCEIPDRLAVEDRRVARVRAMGLVLGHLAR